MGDRGKAEITCGRESLREKKATNIDNGWVQVERKVGDFDDAAAVEMKGILWFGGG